MNLTENQKKWGAWAVMLVAVLVAGALGIQYPLPEPPSEAPPDVVALGTTNLDTLALSEDLTVTDDVTVGDDLTVTGLATVGETLGVTGAATFSNDVTIDDTLNIDELANTATGSTTITPTTTYYQLAPTALLTITIATASASPGDLLLLHNTVSTNTVILDTGATVGGGNVTLSTNDLALFIYGNSKWIEVASPDNS